MTTVTVGVRVTVADEVAADVKAALVDKALGALNQQGLSGSVLSQAVSTDPETGEKVKKSKMDYADYSGPSEHDLNEAFGV